MPLPGYRKRALSAPASGAIQNTFRDSILGAFIFWRGESFGFLQIPRIPLLMPLLGALVDPILRVFLQGVSKEKIAAIADKRANSRRVTGVENGLHNGNA